MAPCDARMAMSTYASTPTPAGDAAGAAAHAELAARLAAAAGSGDLKHAHAAWTVLRDSGALALALVPGGEEGAAPAEAASPSPEVAVAVACGVADAVADFVALLVQHEKGWEAIRVVEEAHRGGAPHTECVTGGAAQARVCVCREGGGGVPACVRVVRVWCGVWPCGVWPWCIRACVRACVWACVGVTCVDFVWSGVRRARVWITGLPS